MHRITIGIDVSALNVRKTGIGHYIANLVTELHRHSELDLYFFTGARWSSTTPPADIAQSKRHVAMRMITRSLNLAGAAGLRLKQSINDRYLAHKFNRGAMELDLDLFHGMNYQLFRSELPSILTIYDISCFRHPETHPDSRVQWQHHVVPCSIERADHIVTISEFSKKEIAQYFGVPANNISVAYGGVNPGFRPRQREEIAGPLNSLGLVPGRYLLTVGTLEPRKNVITLIRAYQRLPETVKQRYPLVVVGMPGWNTDSPLSVARKDLVAGNIRTLGYLPDDVLPPLYAGAAAFAYPSIYEGFGLPVLEALASGIPSVVSNRASLPEVVGDAALIIDPLDVEQWTDTLRQLLEDESLRQRLVSAGLDRAAAFSWRETARITASIYHQILENPRR